MTNNDIVSSTETIPNVSAEGQKSANVPNLRFPQYTSEWRKNRLETLVKMSKGYGITKDQLSVEGQPCILYGELYTTYKNEVISEVKSKTDIDTKGLVYSQANDVIIPSSGETPEDIATACCVMLDDILLGGDLNILRPYNDNGCFLSYQLNGRRKYDIARVAQGASIVHLHNEHLRSLNIFTPESLDEQEKIVSLLALIDERIDTQSKIIEEIKSIKNGISHKVFNDNKFITTYLPLSQFATLKNGYAFKSTTYIDEGKYKVITIANVTGERYYSLEKYNTINTLPMDIQEHQQLKIGDILISLTGNVGRVSYCSTNDTLLNQRVGLLEIKNKVYTEYLYQVLSSLDFEKTMQSCGQGAAQMNIGKSDIENYLIPIPSSEEMMLKISNLLLKLDEKIEIEKDMLSAYKKQKAYLLRQMFI